MQILETKDLKLNQLNVLLYGPPGSGKTTQASKFPKPLFLDFDQGLLSIRNSGAKFSPYYTFPKGKDWGELRKDIDSIIANPDIETVVLDTLTSGGESALAYAQIMNNHQGKQPSFEDWNSFRNEIKDVITRFRSSPKNLVVLAHEKLDKDDLTGKIFGLPLLPGQLAHAIFQMFDEVYHTQVVRDPKGNVSYIMDTKGDAYFSAKTRILKTGVCVVKDYEDMMKNVSNL